MLSTRPYKATDRSAYLELMATAFGVPAAHNDPAQTLDRVLAIPSSVVVVAETNHRLVGAATGGYDGCRGWLYSVAVFPNSRRLGIGRRLVEAVEDALAGQGCPKINLQVRAENATVVAFYEAIGYQVEERVSLGKRLTD